MDLSKRLQGKIAVVTAAGQGIGRAVAERFAAEGAEVHASDLNAALLADAEEMQTAALDATDAQAVAAYMSALPRIDLLVHAVGYVHQGNLTDCPPDEWRKSSAITLDSAYHVIQSALPRMVQHGGSITAIASVVSSVKGLPNRAAYGTMKAGVIGLTKSVACDYLSSGIRCNAVCPGTVDSPSLRARIAELAKKFGSEEEAWRFFLDRQPTGRLGTAAEIAGLCAYLASDEAALMTGQALCIDGGLTI
ncbi:SDR family oxidoreductase [Mameliella sediminis]|uniref:SDR family oxidoreductase n=1 Tax=Mameliella sediminis TaxID=2836866 RepID=UPI001C4819DA|nr:SDR family oxidoreductase [Mameliella sediminis]MBV7393479.1 SDR family oxidoreductase [Mameliella sediminis]